jgi:drug/metabolite transporter (DMT)-like permease
MTMVARYADSETPLRFVFYYHAIGALLFAVPALLAWRALQPIHWVMFGMLALLSVLAQTCAVRAYAVGEASVVGPVDYLRLISAAAVGYALFGEFPGAPTWIGAAVIVASALYVARRGRFGARKVR